MGYFGQWPRSLHARLINYVNSGGAAAIGFDVLFMERSSDSQSDDSLTLDQAKPQIAKTLMEDRKQKAYANMIKQLPDKAKIEYVAPYTAQGYRLTLEK